MPGGRPKSQGLSFTPTHRSWTTMKSRCRNPKDVSYVDYGGANPPVLLCERWEKFEYFLTDLGIRPEGTTLGRLNDRGNYEPGNALWQTKKEQSENRNEDRANYKLSSEKVREIRKLFASGLNMTRIAEQFGVDRSIISRALSGENWKRVV